MPNETTAEAIRDKHLIMVTGAFAVGKTTLMRAIATKNDGYSEVTSFTTRPPRDQVENYRFISHSSRYIDRIYNLAHRGLLINYSVHPTTGFVYGTEPKDYTTTRCMLAATTKSYDSDRHLPFASIVPVAVVVSPAIWLKRIESRHMDVGERQARITEAMQSLEWSLDCKDILFIDNSDYQIDRTASELVSILEHEVAPRATGRNIASTMLRACSSLMA
jgi:guanylate kinase